MIRVHYETSVRFPVSTANSGAVAPDVAKYMRIISVRAYIRTDIIHVKGKYVSKKKIVRLQLENNIVIPATQMIIPLCMNGNRKKTIFCNKTKN